MKIRIILTFSLAFVAGAIHDILNIAVTDILSNNKSLIHKYRSIVSCISNIFAVEPFWDPSVVLKISPDRENNEVDFIHEMQKDFANLNVVSMVITESINRTFEDIEVNCLLVQYFENCETITKFYFDSLKKNFKYLIIIEDYMKEECRKYFNDIWSAIRNYDVSFLIKLHNEFRLITFIPQINPTTCEEEVTTPVLINKCVNGKFTTRDIFPKKHPTDLMKCPLKVGIGPLFPFAMIEGKESLKNYDPLDESRVKGLDYEIAKIMEKYFNATLQLHYIEKHEENPYVNIEFLKLVLNGSLEACVGGLYRIFGDVVEYSGIYARQSVTWIYSAERTLRTWDNMFLNIDGLYLFIVFYFSYSIVWVLVCKFDNYITSLGNTLVKGWGALVGTTSLQDAVTAKQKILNIVYLNMCLHLSVYFSIQLFSFFTVLDPPELLKTNEDVMKSGRTAYLKSLTKYFIDDEGYLRFANTSTECNGFADCAEVCLQRKGVTVFIQGHFYSFQASTAVNDEARMLKTTENLLTVFYEMIMRKESPLVGKFKKMVDRLFEAGITEKLYEQAIGVTVVEKTKIAAQNMITSSYSCQLGCTLRLKQFSGVFWVWIIGCGLSFALFVAEVLWKRKMSQNN